MPFRTALRLLTGHRLQFMHSPAGPVVGVAKYPVLRGFRGPVGTALIMSWVQQQARADEISAILSYWHQLKTPAEVRSVSEGSKQLEKAANKAKGEMDKISRRNPEAVAKYLWCNAASADIIKTCCTIYASIESAVQQSALAASREPLLSDQQRAKALKRPATFNFSRSTTSGTLLAMPPKSQARTW